MPEALLVPLLLIAMAVPNSVWALGFGKCKGAYASEEAKTVKMGEGNVE
jgi:hypothetical protein